MMRDRGLLPRKGVEFHIANANVGTYVFRGDHKPSLTGDEFPEIVGYLVERIYRVLIDEGLDDAFHIVISPKKAPKKGARIKVMGPSEVLDLMDELAETLTIKNLKAVPK